MIKGIGLMTGIHSLIPLFALFNSLGLLNSYLPLILIYLFHSLAFALFTVKTYLDQLPRSFRENALLEGMGSRSYMFRILLPVSLPVLVTAMMVSFLSAWNGFLAPLLFLNNDAMYTISIKLYNFVGSLASGNPKWNLFAATSVINLLFIVVIFLLLKKLVFFSPLRHYEDQD